jgi:hypothetical protein
MLGPRLATRMGPRRVVQLGMVLLFFSIIGLMASIAPSLTSPWFSVSLAGFGAGLGLAISQLGNVVMSSVGPERSSEAGGVQGVAQNLGQSLGTALIGAVLLAGLTTGFSDRVLASDLPEPTKTQVAEGSQKGIPMISQDQAEEIARKNGLSEPQVTEVVDFYGDAQIEALKKALLIASFFVFVGAAAARALPAEPLGGADHPA